MSSFIMLFIPLNKLGGIYSSHEVSICLTAYLLSVKVKGQGHELIYYAFYTPEKKLEGYILVTLGVRPSVCLSIHLCTLGFPRITPKGIM